jgi:hypothetical protein
MRNRLDQGPSKDSTELVDEFPSRDLLSMSHKMPKGSRNAIHKTSPNRLGKWEQPCE